MRLIVSLMVAVGINQLRAEESERGESLVMRVVVQENDSARSEWNCTAHDEQV